MGLINWFKDKIILRLEHDVAMLNTRIEGLELRIDQLKSQIASVRVRKRREEMEEPDDNEQSEKEQIIKAFGGDIPIEFTEKYKNR